MRLFRLATNKSYFGLINILKSEIHPKQVKINLYNTLIRPVLIYGAETWIITNTEENSLMSLERKFLRSIIGSVKKAGEWRRKYNSELYQI